MKRGAVIGDLHVGSVFGLLPPSFITADGIAQPLNLGQRYLWACWQDFGKRVAAWGPDFLIINGDIVDGPQRKQQKVECCLHHMADQKQAAVTVLDALLLCLPTYCKVYVTQGSTYHVGEASEYEEAVAELIEAEQYLSVGSGRFCREVLWLDIEGVVIEAAHHMGTSSGFYRATALDREMQWSAMAAKDASQGIPKADVLLRSHVHYVLGLEHASKLGLVVPCWELQTRFMRKGSLHRMHPNIGGLLLEIDGEEKKRGHSPCRSVKELYSLPPVPITTL